MTAAPPDPSRTRPSAQPPDAPAGAPLAAVALTIVSGLVYTLGYGVAKAVQTETGLSPWQMAFLRYAILLVAAALLLPFLPRPAERLRSFIAPPAARTQRVAGFWLGASSLLALAAYQRLPLAEGTVLGFTMPLFLVALAPLMLKERVPLSRWLAVLTGFVGVVIVARPGFGGSDATNWAALLQVGTALAYAFYQIIARQARAVATPWSLTMQSALVGVVLLGPAMPAVWTPLSPLVIAAGASFTALMSAGQVLLVMALRRAEVSALGPWHYVKITWALGLDLAVFASTPDAWAVVGGLVILGANVWLLRKGGPSGG